MLRIGDTLNGLYQIEREIGSGTGGIIFQAEHLRLHKKVIVKLVRDQVKGKLDTRREADILKGIKHTYLPQVYDFVEEGQEMYTVMDFVPGENMESLLEQHGPYSQKRVLHWSSQLCEALVYLHSQIPPIIHGDIKPANIMLTSGDNICLIDFNISLLFDSNSQYPIGLSRLYAAPELFDEIESNVLKKNEIKEENLEKTELLAELDEKQAKLEKTELLVELAEKQANLEKTELLAELDEEQAKLKKTELLAESGEGKTPNEKDSSAIKKHQTFILSQGQGTQLLDIYTPRAISASTEHHKKIEVLSKRKIDTRSDIYSLGVTLFQLLNGEILFDENRQCVWDEKKQVGEAMRYIVQKATAYRPEDRFQTADEMLHAIQNIHRLDSTYRRQMVRQIVWSSILATMLAFFIILTYSGWNMMKKERMDAYQQLIQQSDQASLDHDFARASALAQQAQEIFPHKSGAYRAQAAALFREGRYDECISYIENSLITLEGEAISPQEKAEFTFLQASSLFEQQYYEQAIPFYEQSVLLNDENMVYYRDYAIALARLGRVKEAEQFLKKAQELQIDTCSLMLVEGELALTQMEYKQAEKFFTQAIQQAQNDYDLQRAYLMCVQTYEEGDSVFPDALDKKLQLLEQGVKQLPIQKSMILTEKLGEAYEEKARATLDEEYDKKSILCFQALLDAGYYRFYIMNNLAILYQNIGDYAQAHQILQKMEQQFPKDYRVYMQLAFLCADEQSKRRLEERSYEQTLQAYKKAEEYYRLEKEPSDPEMQMLKAMMHELEAGGWITLQ